MPEQLLKNKKYLAISEAAKLLGVSIDTIRRWDKAGKLSSVRLDGKNRYFVTEELITLKHSLPLTISQTSAKLGVSASTLRRLEQKGVLHSERNSRGERLYNQEDINNYLDSIKKPTKYTSTTTFMESPVVTAISQQAIVESPQIISPLDMVMNSQQIQDLHNTPLISHDSSLETNLLEQTFDTQIKSQKSKKFSLPLHSLGAIQFSQFSRYYMGAAVSVFAILFIIGAYSGYTKLVKTNTSPLTSTQTGGPTVLAEATEQLRTTLEINIDTIYNGSVLLNSSLDVRGLSLFSDDITVEEADLLVNNGNIEVTNGTVTASNLIYSVTGGENVTVTGGQNPIISFDAPETVLSLQGQTGEITLSAGNGISIDGLTISNSDTGSSQNIFSTILVDGTAIPAGSNTDILRFVAGSGVLLTTDVNNKEITISSDGLSPSPGWADDGSVIRLITSTDSVGVGTTTPGAKIESQSAGTPQLRLSYDGTAYVDFEVDNVGNLTIGATGSQVNFSGLAVSASSFSCSDCLNFSEISDSLTLDGNLSINPTGSNYTIDIDSGTLFVDSANNRVGIGTTTPSEALTVLGNIRVTGTTSFGPNDVPYTWPNADGSNGFVLATNGSGQLFWQDVASATGGQNYFEESNGLISPKNSTVDFAVGGNSTASAAFAVTNVNNGTPQITLSDGSTSLYLTATGSIATTNNADITLGSATSGNINLYGFVEGILRTDASGNIINGAVNLGGGSNEIIGVLPVANGGTGQSTLNDLITLGAHTTGNYVASITNGSGITGASISEGASITLGINLTTSGDTATESSNSGLEVSASGLSLIRGCDNGQILKWNNGTQLWECSEDVGGLSNAVINLQEGDVLVSNTASTLDFSGTDFALNESPAGEVNIAIDYVNSGITRSGENETISGDWTFSNLLTADTLNITSEIQSGGTLRLDAAGNLSNIGTTEFNGITYTWPGSITDGYVLSTNGSGALTWTDPTSLGTNFWQRNDGALSPLNITDDILVGGTATSSALVKLTGTAGEDSFINTGNVGIGTTTPTAKLEVNGGGLFANGLTVTSGTISLPAGEINNSELENSSITVTAGAGLSGGGLVSLGGSVELTNAGVTSLNSANGAITLADASEAAGTITINNATTLARGLASFSSSNFSVVSGAVSIAVNGVGASELAATTVASGQYGDTAGDGIAYFTVDGDGRLTAAGQRALSLTSDITGTLAVGNGGTGITSVGSAGSIAYSNGSTFAFNSAGTTGQILVSNGTSAPSWIDASAVGTNYWQENDGALSPLTVSNDLLLGGNATSSALIRLAGTANEDSYFNTGGNLGIGTTNPGALLDVNGTANIEGLATFGAGVEVNGDTITDFVGTGLTLNSGSLETTLGTSIDLNSAEVTGILPVANGGTGANTLNNLITLATHTTGNYVATVTGNTQIGVTGSGSENAGVTLAINADSIGDSQLAFNTGQNLTTTSDVEFNSLEIATLTIGGIDVSAVGTDNVTSGASLVGVFDEFANSAGTTVQEVLNDLDAAIAGGAHDPVTLAGSLDYLTLSDQEITLNAIDLTTDVTGILPVANGGTGANTLNNLIALGTHTTGNYVATVTGNTQIGVSGSGSENASVTLAINADSIGDTQLAFNTGQNLTTTSDVEFNSLEVTALTIGGIDLAAVGTDNLTSGATLIGVFDEFTNSSATTVQGVLADLDAAVSGSSHDPVTLAGTLDYLTLSDQEITLNAIDLTTDVTGILPVANGGTGATTLNNLITLAAHTTGNYVATVTGNTQIGVSGSGSENAGVTLAINADSIGDSQLEFNTGQNLTTVSDVEFNSLEVATLTIGGLDLAAVGTDNITSGASLVGVFDEFTNSSSTNVQDVLDDLDAAIAGGAHDPVTLAGSLNYLTLSDQEITLNAIDLTTDVTGILPVANGGTGATTLNNLITLATHTTGNYVATVTGNTQIGVTGSGSENAGVTLAINADSIGDSQLAFNTGQNLTTTSDVEFNSLEVTALTIGGIDLSDVGTDNLTSGASLVGVFDEFANSSSTNVQDVLDDFDAALAGVAHDPVTLAGTYDYLTLSDQEITLNAIDLTTDVTGILPVANGGTGANTLNNLITLATHTTGNYVATVTGNTQIGVTGSGSENAGVTLAINADSIGDSQLAFNTGQNLTTTSDVEFNSLEVTALTIGGIDLASGGTDNVTSGASLVGVFDEFANSSSTTVQGVLNDLDAAIAGGAHDPVTLAGSYDYLTLSDQEITLNAIDLTTDVTGILPVANGGTGANTLNNLIALGTHTTGNYVATVTGNTQIGVSGSGSETASVTLSINADSIGDSQLAFNTGQNLTTTSDVEFNSLTLGGIGLSDTGADNITSGASLVGVFDEFTNSSATTVQGVLNDLDAAVSGSSHDPVTLAGSLDYLTLSDQEITLNAIDLTTDVTGILPVANGGTGANTLNNLITLATHTTGNYVATVTGNTQIGVTGSGSENAGVTLAINTNSIGDTQLEYNTGQNLTTTSDVEFNSLEVTALTVGGIGLEDVGTDNITSGASLVGVFDEFTNSSSTTVQGVLADLDAAVSGSSHDPVTLAGSLNYLTLSDQEITLNAIDLTTDVTGILPVANGGTGANTLNNLITLATHTTGNYVATVTGNTQIGVTGSGSENAGVTLAINADSIGNTQLEFNTGQDLTTTSDVTFNSLAVTALTIGGIDLSDVGTDNVTSGSSLVGVFDEFTNSSSTNVQDVLDDLDAAIASGTHDPVTLAGTYDYLTLSDQEITLNAIDLTTDVTGILPVANGGTGATTLNNLITLATHTTGNYVATVTGNTQIGVTGSGSENAGVTLAINADSIGDTQLAFNTGQNLTTTSDVEFNSLEVTALTIGGIDLSDVGTDNLTSGATLVGVFDEFTNSNGTTVQQVLNDLDAAVSGSSHDPVTFAGTLDYLTLSDQEITLNAIDLTTDVTGVLPVANGGTGATTLNNLITLATHTTGNYVATITGSTQIGVTGSGSENAGVTLAINADSIGNTQLEYNTGQDLTTTSSPTFDALTLTTLTISGDSITDFVGTGLSLNSGVLETTLGVDIDLTSEVTGTLPVGNGGTGAVSFTAGGILYGAGTSPIGASSQGSAGQVLVSGGAGAPTWTDSGTVGTNYWQYADGALAPVNVSDDILLGSSATSSALIRLAGTANEDSFFNTGGNVGIGTTTPLAKLDVRGGVRLGANTDADNILNTSATAGAPSGYLYWGDRQICDTTGNCAGSGGGLTGSGTANYIALFTGAGTLGDSPIYNDSGNIGIGTITPDATLDVDGTAIFSGLATFASGIEVNSDTITDFVGTGLTLNAGSLETTLGTDIDLTSEVTGILPVANGGTGANTLNNLIALGTHTTGNYVATITGNTQIGVTGSGSENAGITLAINADSIGDTQLEYNTGQDLTTTSSPTFDDLTVAGDLAVNGGNITSSQSTFNFLATTVTTLNIGSIATTNFAGGYGNSGITFGTDGSIQSNGDLTIDGTTTLNGVEYTWPGADASVPGYVLSSDASGQLAWIDIGTATTQLWASDNGALYPNNSSLDFFIGGQSSDSAKFGLINVNSGIPTASISAGTTGATYITANGTIATTNMQSLTFGTSTTADILFNNDGNVGIGTNDPLSKLDVRGGIRLGANTDADNILNTSSTGSAPSGYLYWGDRTICDSTGNCAGVGGGITGSGTTNYIAKFTDTGAIGSSPLYDDGGNVGIGTVSPSYLLEVDGTFGSSGLATFASGINVNAETITDFTGTGLTNNSGSLETTLGTTVDLTSEVTGILPVANGGTGANTLNNLITLGTHTTGNYVATVTGSTQIGVSGSGSENAGVTLAINADSIGNTQLEYNTGQDLTTTSTPTFSTLSLTSLIVSGDTISDFAGSGLQVTGNVLSTTLGTDISLTSEVTGTLPVGNGGTGVTSLSDVVGTANQVAVTGGTGRVIGGNVTLSLPQDIDTGADVEFGSVTIGGIGLGDAGTDNITSGAFLVGTFDEFTNSEATTVQEALADLDAAISGGAHDPVTLAGSFDYLTLSDQVITLNAIDLTTDVTGVLPVANGGTGATTLNNLIALGTHTTGNYVATITGNTQIGVTGSGSENAGITLAINADSIGDTQLEYNTGQNLTTTSDVEFNSLELATLTIGGIDLSDVGTDNLTSGATLVGVFDEFTNSDAVTVQEALADLDAAVSGSSHDPVTLAGSLNYLTLSDQEITLTAIDLTTDVTGILPVANGGTGANTLNNLITLGTHTTGNYVATVTGNSQISVSGSGSETAGVSISIAADSIGDSQLAFNTGQNLTTTSDVEFNSLTIDGIGLADLGADNVTSGAYLVGVFDEFTNSSATTVQGVLNDLDSAISGASHDPVTLAGTLDYLTLSDQEITLNAIDLTTDVTGVLPVANGGTGATTLNNLITLATHTTGNYVATVTGNTQIGVTGSGSENAGITLAINADSIGDSQLAFNTGQNLTTTSDVEFNSLEVTALTIGGIDLAAVGTDNITSGASLVGVFDEFANSAGTTVQDVLDDLDAAIASGTHDPVTLAGSLNYLTLSDQEITLNAIDLTTDVTGILPVANGGTGANTLNNLIALGTHTTGNYVATVTGNTQIGVSGSGSENAGVTLAINADSIGDSQLAFNTGQNLTTTSDVEFNSLEVATLTIGGIDLAAVGTDNVTSGASLVGVFDEFTNSSSTNVQAVLNDLDAAIASGTHDPVTLAGTLDYLTLSDQEITLNAIDLTTDVTGILPIANGGTGATTLNNLITLATHTTGNYVATVTGNTQIGVTGSGSENAGVTLAINADSIGDSQLEFNTGQDLTTTSDVEFNSLEVTALTIGGIDLAAVGTDNVTSGASLVGVFDEFTYSASTNVQDVLDDLDAAIASGTHDAVTLAGSLDYLTLSGQEITLNAIDLTTDVTGILPVANGGTGANTLNNLITLATHTTGNYVATVTGNTQIGVSGSGSENAGVTLAINADSIGDSQLAFNTGQNLTTTSDVEFNSLEVTALTIGGIDLSDAGTDNITSGASLVGVFDEFTNSSSTNVQDVLDDLDAAIVSGTHDPVTLAGSLDYLTLSDQEITLNAIDLTTDVTGILPVANGGTGATTLNNLITLATHTTGNYVATVTGNTQIGVTGSGSENAGVTLAINADSIGDSQLAFNTGQNLTTTSDVEFNSLEVTALTIGGIDLSDVGTDNITSGASLVGVYDEFTNSASTNVQDVLDDLDAAIASGTHDAVTLAGSLDYLTLSSQEITLNAIDLTTDVTGILPVANGGTGANTLNNLITLATHTTGNYVATVTGNTQIGVTGSGSENAGVTLAINADSIGDSQLAFNTGQNLTTTSDVEFNSLEVTALTIGGIDLSDVGTDNITSGASLVGVYDEFTNSSSTNIQDVLDDFDAALVSGTHDPVTLAGSLDYLTLSDQEITLNAIDLTSDVTGILPVANGGTGATTLDNLITLATHTTGNYVATVTGNTQIGVTGSGSENAGITLAINADAIGDSQLAFNTGQDLTTISDVEFNSLEVATLTIGGIDLAAVGTDNVTSGASLVGVYDEFANSASTTVQDVLDDLDAAITSGTHDPVTLAGSYDYLTLSDQEITLGQIDLTTDVTGILPVANGGTGANTLNNLITLGTHTTGNYVATVTGNSQISVSGSGSETAGVTLSISADSIGDSQLAFNTGQDLTTISDVEFNSLTLDGIGLEDAGSDNLTSGASIIGVYDEFANSSATNVQDVLDDLDAALSGATHDPVTLAGTLDYLTLSDQEITLNAIDLTTDVTGILPVANGGTGASTLNDLITLATHTTGNYVATVTGNTQIGVTGSGSENAGITLAINADSIGDSQLAFNTGQDLTTVSDVEFNSLEITSLTLGTDTVTDIVGTGLALNSGVLETTLGVSVDLGSEITGTLGETNGGTGQNTYATGDMLYSDSSNSLTKLTIGDEGDILFVNSGGVPEWGTPGSLGISFWQRNAGAVAPLNVSDDVLVGHTATASALVRLPGTTNQDAWFSLGTGNVGIGDTTPTFKLDVNGTGRFVSDLTLTTGVINSEVASGGTAFTLDADSNFTTGNLFALTENNGGTTHLTIDNAGNLNLGGTSGSANASNTITGSTAASSALYLVSTSNATKGNIYFHNTLNSIDPNGNGTLAGDLTVTGGNIGIGTGPFSLAAIRTNGSATFDIWSNSGVSTLTIDNLGSGGTVNTLFDGGNVYLNSGRLGVGTITPDTKLHVTGATTGKALAIFNETGDQNILTASSSGTTRFVIQNNGNVGIGTSTPGSLLSVNGTLNVTGDTTFNGVTYGWPGSQAAGSNYILVNDGSGELSWLNPGDLPNNDYWQRNGGALSGVTVTDDILVGANATGSAMVRLPGRTNEDAWFNLGTGNVGIGDTTPTYKLDVNGTGRFTGDLTLDSALSVAGSLTANGALTLGDGGDTIGIDSSSWDISTGGAASGFTGFASSGNIDLAALNAGGIVKADVTTGRLSIATAGTDYQVPLTSGVDYEVPLTFTNGLTRTSNSVALGGTLTGATAIDLNGNNLNFTGTGNVGIGSSGPDAKLDVLSTSQQLRLTHTDSTYYAGFTVDGTGKLTIATQAGLELTGGSIIASDFSCSDCLDFAELADSMTLDANWNISGSGSNFDVNFDSNTLVVDSSANSVGIGTNAPIKSLHVQAGGTSELTSSFGDGLLFSTSNASGARIFLENLNGASGQQSLAIVNENITGVGTTYFGSLNDSGGAWVNNYILSMQLASGNVGIGTSTPGSKLDVNGNTNITGTLTASGLVTGEAFTDGTTTWDDGAWASTAGIAWDLAASTNALNIESGLFNIDTTNSRIGIGTSTPGYKLDLQGSVASYLGNFYNSSTNIAAGGLNLRLDGGGNILNLNYAGTDVFSVSGTQATIGVPTQFTASGDMGIAYDLNFTNPVASYINSAAPLSITAGEPFNSSNLTLKTYNSGQLYGDLASGALFEGGNSGSRALLQLNQLSAADIFTASSSGTTKFTITNGGSVNIAAGESIDTISAGSLSLAGTTANALTIGRSGITTTFGSTSWTATPTISGRITASAGLTIAAAQTVTLTGVTGNNGLLYANTSGNITAVSATSTSGLCMLSGLNTAAPSWQTCPTGSSSFSALTSGTNTTAAMVIGTGGSLTYSGSGTIDATALLGNTWASPEPIGSTTPAAANFTTLGASGTLTISSTSGDGLVFSSNSLTTDIVLQNDEAIDNNNNGFIEFQGVNGSNNTDLRIDLDGSYPILESPTDTTIGIGEDLDVEGEIQTDLTSPVAADFALCHTVNGAQGDAVIYDCNGTAAADYMEMYPVALDVQKGDLVTIGTRDVITDDGDKIKELVKSTQAYQTNLIGVVSDMNNAGDFNSIGHNLPESENIEPIALSGRILVKVSTQNGQIQPGDHITTSSIPGVGMKSTRAGHIVGQALEAYTNSDPNAVGMIMVFIKATWVDPNVQIASNGNIQITENNGDWLALDGSGNIIDNKSAFSEATIANLKAGKIEANDVFATDLVSTTGIFDSLNASFLTSDSITINDTLSAGRITTDEITMSDFKVSANTEMFSIASTAATESALFSVDMDGNASLSGTLTTAGIESETGNIETLTVKNLIVENISGLTASSSAFFDLGQGISADMGEFDFVSIASDLTVLGTTTLREASITDSLAIGAGELMITSNSINTLSDTLEIQSLAQAPVSVMAGAVIFNTDGTVKFAENVEFEKDIAVKGEIVASVIKGVNDVLNVSGSATFEKFGVEASEQQPVNLTTVNASGSAGLVTLKANQTQIRINNEKVTEDSLIFITPVGSTGGEQIYIKDQVEGEYFTVEIENSVLNDVKFNFLIVN